MIIIIISAASNHGVYGEKAIIKIWFLVKILANFRCLLDWSVIKKQADNKKSKFKLLTF